jgi:arsenate reductase-like glutaredoxin family protein
MNLKCPYLVANKFCSYRNNPPIAYKKLCGYKDCSKCELFLEWLESLYTTELTEINKNYILTKNSLLKRPNTP